MCHYLFMNFNNLLTSLGISAKEASVYQALLNEGETDVPALVKELGEKRGVVYFLVNSLVKRGLVIRKGSGKDARFAPDSPYKLQDLVKTKGEEINIIQKNLVSALPSIISEYNLTTNKPTIRYFEGKDGLKEVFNDIYSAGKKEVIGAADLESIEKIFPGFLSKTLIPKRVRGKLHSKAILLENSLSRQAKAKDASQNRESKLVDPKKYPLPAEIDVYENKVAMLSFRKNSFVGLIVEDSDIAISLKSIFELAFEKI